MKRTIETGLAALAVIALGVLVAFKPVSEKNVKSTECEFISASSLCKESPEEYEKKWKNCKYDYPKNIWIREHLKAHLKA